MTNTIVVCCTLIAAIALIGWIIIRINVLTETERCYKTLDEYEKCLRNYRERLWRTFVEEDRFSDTAQKLIDLIEAREAEYKKSSAEAQK